MYPTIIDDKDIVTERAIGSKVVCDRPAWLVSVVVSCHHPIRGYCYVADETVATPDFVLCSQLRSHCSAPVDFKRPVRFKRGLFVFATADVECTGRYAPDY